MDRAIACHHETLRLAELCLPVRGELADRTPHKTSNEGMNKSTDEKRIDEERQHTQLPGLTDQCTMQNGSCVTGERELEEPLNEIL